MDLESLSAISIEACGSIMLLVIAYKIYRMKINTTSDGKCCRWLTFHMDTENEGNAAPVNV
tara:strand:- start:63 stop:245 length:183 start_codon:yes stop_codon:yes gene_type:complete